MPYRRIRKGKVEWVASVMVKGRRKEEVCGTRAEAKAREVELKKLLSSPLNQTATASLGKWAEDYLDHTFTSFVPRVYKEKRRAFQRFFQAFSPDLLVDQLAKRDVESHFDGLVRKFSQGAAYKDRKNLLAAWNWGVKTERISETHPNPIHTSRNYKPDEKPINLPALEDFEKVLGACDEYERVLLLTLFYTAARCGEGFRLKWSDVDFEHGRVRLSTRKRKGGVLEWNWVEMPDQLAAVLRDWQGHCPFPGNPNVFALPEGHAFRREDIGRPPRSLSKLLGKLCEKVGVERFGFHMLRRLHATILGYGGKPTLAIRDQLRHMNANTTDKYLKKLIGPQTRIGDALPDLTGGGAKSPDSPDGTEAPRLRPDLRLIHGGREKDRETRVATV